VYYLLAFVFPPLALIVCERHKLTLFFKLPVCLLFTSAFWLPGVLYAIVTAVRPHYKRKRAVQILERFRQQKLQGEPLSVG
jgi:hypothetical protein